MMPTQRDASGDGEGRNEEPVTRSWLSGQVAEEASRQMPGGDAALLPLSGLNVNISGARGFVKLYYGVRCECATAAVLTLEVSASKSRRQVREAMPALVGKLAAQAKAFRAMPCSAHARLRSAALSSPASARKQAADRVEREGNAQT